MEADSPGRRFGLRDLVVVLAVVGLLLCALIPSILQARGEARRARCITNMKMLGLGLLNHESALKRFPPSCLAVKNANGQVTDMKTRGWSWCVLVLPYIEAAGVLDPWDVRNSGPLDKSQSTRDVLSLALREFHCPSFQGNRYVDPKTKTEAITNYKAMGATHLSSLLVASPRQSVPKYDPKGIHPDGGLYPGSTHGVNAFKVDGTSHSFLLCESVEQNVARWTVGAETCVVGLPEQVNYAAVASSGGGNPAYFAPEGYSANLFNDQTTIPASNNFTYLDWDYDTKPYIDTLSGVSLVPRSARASGPMKYGPSSHHPGTVSHLMADGSVRTVSKSIDAACYMFAITRNGNEPAPPVELE